MSETWSTPTVHLSLEEDTAVTILLLKISLNITLILWSKCLKKSVSWNWKSFVFYKAPLVPWETSKVFKTSAWTGYFNDLFTSDCLMLGLWFYAQVLTTKKFWVVYYIVASLVLHLERQARYFICNYKNVNHIHISQQLVSLCQHINDVRSVTRTN